jgi:NTP pyrophosphatase (non-canonical NTP hydrolase)
MYATTITGSETMDNKTYLEESARTASAQFHDDKITPGMIETALQTAIDTGNMIDAIKKGLYYGKSLPEFHESIEHYDRESDLNPRAVDQDILHAALGLFTEATEMLEAIFLSMKGAPFDKVNMAEELGDAEWYAAMLYRALDETPENVKQVNIDKLRHRYPDKFTSMNAISRDLNKEREILEEGHS